MIANVTTSSKISVISTLLLLRILIGYQPHSGQDNYHGKLNAYGGDYEAQRHWMELTYHLPIGDWYWYDLEYWGLDYPPLTAYVSFLCGYWSDKLIGADSVALYTSRAYEDPFHKAYMRATVLVWDSLVYFSIVWIAIKGKNNFHTLQSLWSVVLALAQPALVLIDHGHFQYNSVSMGLALWGFFYMTKDHFRSCIIGSVFFCLALNFKQMTLYYAPVVFAYLLGRCFSSKAKYFFPRFCALGATVIFTFLLLWWPFLYYPPSQNNDLPMVGRLSHVIHRIFPFQRGLFEDKVANIWCALSSKPISIRERIPKSMQPLASMSLTLALISPACYKLFLIGKSNPTSSRHNNDFRLLLWGSASTALAFFLASFQVHEKSILIALAPISLLVWDDSCFTNWFAIVATWTLWPLLCIDRLQVAYCCTMIVYLTLVWLFVASFKEVLPSCLDNNFASRAVVPLSGLGMLSLHMLQLVVPPPSTLPDLYPVLWSIAGCGMFCISWLVTCWQLLKGRGKGKEKIV